MRKYFQLLNAKTKMKCVGVLFLALAGALLSSIWPVKLGELYTAISNQNILSLSQGITRTLTFGLILLSAECITILRRVALDCILASHEADMREESIEKVLKMPVDFAKSNMKGEKTAQISQGIVGLSQLIKLGCNEVVTTVFTAVCTLYQVIANAPGVVMALMLSYLVITIAISYFQIRSQNGIRENIVRRKNAYEGNMYQALSNVEMIRGMNAEEFERERLRPSIRKISYIEKAHHYYMGMFDSIKQICKASFQVGLLILSMLLITNGKMHPGGVISVCLLFQQLSKPVDDVYRFMDEIASSVIKAGMLVDVMLSPNSPVFEIEGGNSPMTDSGICLQDVVITNPEGNKKIAVYERIELPRGQRIALVGPNGCGKTTLVRSIMRIAPLAKGKITVFGRDQADFSQKELTTEVYYSPQDSYFVAGTVKDNLLYGLSTEVGDEELLHALREVRLFGNYEGVITKKAEDILEVHISEGATELSGGMKQRLVLARAFLRMPKMFIFDEITANLDTAATDLVLTNIENYAHDIGAGIIYISHDGNVINRCDTILHIDNKAMSQERIVA